MHKESKHISIYSNGTSKQMVNSAVLSFSLFPKPDRLDPSISITFEHFKVGLPLPYIIFFFMCNGCKIIINAKGK